METKTECEIGPILNRYTYTEHSSRYKNSAGEWVYATVNILEPPTYQPTNDNGEAFLLEKWKEIQAKGIELYSAIAKGPSGRKQSDIEASKTLINDQLDGLTKVLEHFYGYSLTDKGELVKVGK
jgi:hypothetical protein